MTKVGHDTLKTRDTLVVDGKEYGFYSFAKASAQLGDFSKLPYSLKVLLENLLRFEDNRSVSVDDIKAAVAWQKEKRSDLEIAFRPTRVLMQDFTGVPAVADLAAMRQAMVELGSDPEKINPLSAVDLVIDHSVMIDNFGTKDSFKENVTIEFERNAERYAFLRWGQQAFKNFRVVPPGTGICHQVNLEYLAETVWVEEDQNGKLVAYPDTVVGTDSHTTMVNGLAVLGWGVGGIEAEAAMLGQPISMVLPEVVGFKLTGKLPEGTTATDLVLTITNILRSHGVVGKFVEFCGDGLDNLTLADRATIANMAPEYGATCGFFPIDSETINYLRFTGRDEHRVNLVESYAKAQGIWREAGAEDPVFTEVLGLDLGTVQPTLAGPKRPQDKVLLSDMASGFKRDLESVYKQDKAAIYKEVIVHDKRFVDSYKLGHGSVVLAAITSCTNTSNPSVMIAAGLLARKARYRGLAVKPWVKTSLAPGSQVVTEYLNKSHLQEDLDALGFTLAGYGCTTCIGNSGPLPEAVTNAIVENELVAAAVLSGNRNFEGRIHPHIQANYLASPPLVVAYALAGTVNIDLRFDPIGKDPKGQSVFLKDIWPSNYEIQAALQSSLTPEMFKERYGNVFDGTEEWRSMASPTGQTYVWEGESTYVRSPPFFEGISANISPIQPIKGARALAVLGDSVTTDHISPAGSIKASSPAGVYLSERGIKPIDFNSYGARRGNHEVMMRGTFANIRIKNEMLDGIEGGLTKLQPSGEQMSIYDAAMKYAEIKTPLVIFAGKEYGTGSSRDWAAKGTKLLGVRAVIAESFERIHRSNLVGMGILPLQLIGGATRKTLGITGLETFDVEGLDQTISAKQNLTLVIHRADGKTDKMDVLCRIDTADEVAYFLNDGILTYVLRGMAA